jgi:hypothetical protein
MKRTAEVLPVEAREPRRGPGAFQWNAGGWFGSQVGSTLWLLILGALLFTQGRTQAGATALVAFAISNAIGTWLWSRRVHVAPYPAIQALVAVMGMATLAVFVGLDYLGELAALDPQGAARPGWAYGLLAMYPGLMLLFFVQERAARRSSRVR